ncbi:hypothetical protein BVRB_009870 [Beta vulgaris subsp. vulgaris]|uniref:Uncharacterized protein n=1 Tax=Beta vulgaris subsp. vulgaris TaxID=3555 RepID=A0A0J8DWM8_BETVV|nr:hypothetical protein BVRB_009870 [Beta vulgaris subsp. vulgaris]
MRQASRLKRLKQRTFLLILVTLSPILNFASWSYLCATTRVVSRCSPLLMLRVTRFKCGGVSIGLGTHHYVTDGIGYAYFINSWARLARGFELNVQPFHARAVYLAPRDPPQVSFQHLEYEPAIPPKGNQCEMSRECLFKLSKDQVDTLKVKATFPSQEVESYKLSTYEILAGHVWRCASKARGLIDDQCVKLHIPIDGRSRLRDPTIPQEYFGNVVFFTACTAKASDITSKPLWYAANKVHEALQKVEKTEYLRSAIDYLEMQSDITNLVRVACDENNPYLSINSWGRIPFYEADFGWGKPKFVGASILPCKPKQGWQLFTMH